MVITTMFGEANGAPMAIEAQEIKLVVNKNAINWEVIMRSEIISQ